MNYNNSSLGATGKRCAIVVIAIGESKIWDLCKKSVLKYCEKYNIELKILSEKNSELLAIDDNELFNMFQKNNIYHLFNKYDRILRLDWDVLITPNCPNIFEIVPEDKIGGVFEDYGTRELERRKRIEIIQNHLGNIDWKNGYLNAGIIVASKQHKEIFRLKEEDINILNKIELTNKEQSYFNYFIRKLGYEVFPLSYKFNHMSLFSESWHGYSNRLDSYFIHYAGEGIFEKKQYLKNKLQQIKMDYKILYTEKLTNYDVDLFENERIFGLLRKKIAIIDILCILKMFLKKDRIPLLQRLNVLRECLVLLKSYILYLFKLI